MTETQCTLFRRIEQFPFDAPGATFPYSRRLAKENSWTPQHTQRVIAEYRRFAFLFVAAGHPVAPSQAVDEAWHLHMLYSENYWNEFCGGVLGRPLHHRPSQGIRPPPGATPEPFADWYRDTLASYRRLFEEDPPSDIWPSPDAVSRARPKPVRVDPGRYWVIRKPRLRLSQLATGLFLVAALAGLGCSDAIKGPNPLDWTGTDFLALYAVGYSIVYALAWGLRYRLTVPLPGGVPPANLDPYEVTYLLSGPGRAVEAAVANLVRQGALVVAPDGHLTRGAPYSGTSEFERHVCGLASTVPSRFRALQGVSSPYLDDVGRSLTAKGLIMSDNARQVAALVPLVVSALPILLGFVKISVGLSRERPVSNLVALCVISTLVTLISFARRPYLSRYGAAVRQDLWQRYAFLRGSTAAQIEANSGPDSDDFVLAVGLYGPAMLDPLLYGPLMIQMEPGMMSGGGVQWSGGSNCNSGGASCNAGGSSCNSGGSSCNSGETSSCSSGGSSCSSGGGGGCGGCSSS